LVCDETEAILKAIDELIRFVREDADLESMLDMFEDVFVIREKLREMQNLLISEITKVYDGKGV